MWLDPVPIEEDLPLLYAEYLTHGDASEQEQTSSIEESILWKISRKMYRMILCKDRWENNYNSLYLDAPLGSLLEIGCGAGERLAHFRSQGMDVRGLELDPIAAKHARKKHNLNVDNGDLHSIGYEAESFDYIAMSHVMEHLSDPKGLLEECWRILKPGGTLVSVVPNSESLGYRVYRDNWLGLEAPRHFSVFNQKNSQTLFKQAGYQNIHCRNITFNAPLFIFASQGIKKNGYYDMNTIPTRRDLLVPTFFQLIELVLVSIGRDMGEECLVTALKPA
jgi:SAM-dependent methyltransferase